MAEIRERTAVRIGFDIERDRNRELLAKLFGESEIVEFSGAVPAETDLCIIDEAAFERSAERFDAWHAQQSPLFAPVVLLSESETADPWEEFEESLATRIDAILPIPMPKAEVRARIDNLLEMREMSRELAEEQQLTQSIFQSSPLAKFVVEPDGTIVRVNERAAELFEKRPSELVGRPYDAGDWAAVDEDGREIPDEELPLARLLETGTPVYGYEHAIEQPGREDRWVSVNMAPIQTEADAIDHVVVVFEDITTRRTQAARLEQQLDLFQKAQDIANVGAWEYDVHSDELYWTEQVYEIHDISTATPLTTEKAMEAYHPEDQSRIRDAFQRALDGGETYEIECRIITESGAKRWVRTRGEPQYGDDGEVVRIRGTIQDITERKERVMELQRMTNAVDKAPIGIVLSDPTQEDNPLIYVNEGFVEQTGYSRAEAVGRNCRFLQGEDTDERTVAELRRRIDAEEPVAVTIRNYRADGSAYWNRLEVAPIRDDDGTVVNYIGFQQDVTDLMERQRQLTMLDRYLRHNIRNRMSVINGHAELIQSEGDTPLTEYAGAIEETSATLLDNMEKERAVTRTLRTERGPTRTELMALLRPVVSETNERHSAATVTLSGPDAVAVTASAELAAAFEELVENAIEHNDGPAPTAEITVAPGDEVVRVRVADDGPGIPETELEVLRDANAETPINHGQGLGLWLVYLTVQRSGGTIELTESTSDGSVVTIELPAADEEPVADPTDGSPEQE